MKKGIFHLGKVIVVIIFLVYEGWVRVLVAAFNTKVYVSNSNLQRHSIVALIW